MTTPILMTIPLACAIVDMDLFAYNGEPDPMCSKDQEAWDALVRQAAEIAGIPDYHLKCKSGSS